METEHAVVALSGLNIAGALIQILGVGLALFGALRAWKEFGDEGFADPVLMPIRRAGQRLSAALERVIRRLLRRRIHLEGRAVVATGAGGVMIRGRKQFRVLPGDLDPSLAVVELDERTRELMGLSSDMKDRFDDEQTRREQETTQLGDRLEKTRKELWERDRDIARSGIRLEFLGLFFVLVGFVLQTQPFV